MDYYKDILVQYIDEPKAYHASLVHYIDESKYYHTSFVQYQDEWSYEQVRNEERNELMHGRNYNVRTGFGPGPPG